MPNVRQPTVKPYARPTTPPYTRPIAVILAVLLLAACGSSKSSERAASKQVDDVIELGKGSEAEGSGRGPSRGPNITVGFEETSGPGGVPRAFRVNTANRVLELQRGSFPAQRLRVQHSELSRLIEIVRGPGFSMMKARYGTTLSTTGEPSPETYHVSVAEKDHATRVVTEKDAADQPTVLREAILELLRLRRLVEEQGV